MLKVTRSGAIFGACATLAILAPLTARAGVMSIPGKATLAPVAPFEAVHYRYYHHHHHHWRYGHHRHYYRHYGYYPYYNPAGAVAGAAVGLATAPAWALFGGPYW